MVIKESPVEFVKTWFPRPIPGISDSVYLSGAHEFAFLIISQMILMLLVQSKVHTCVC